MENYQNKLKVSKSHFSWLKKIKPSIGIREIFKLNWRYDISLQ
jgi:hypothetical protein